MSKCKLLKTERNCSEMIKSGKYTNTYHESKARWNKQFKEMDDRRSVPFYKRMKHLKECFSKETLQDLLDIGIEVYDEPEEPEDYLQDENAEEIRSKKICPSEHDEEKTPEPTRIRKPNPYLNFMRKSEKDAQIWRPTSKPPFEALPLTEKADLLMDAIVDEFYEWFTEVGSEEGSEYDKATILELFKIPCPYPIARSIDHAIQILGCVPKEMAVHVGAPELAENVRLRQEMAKDQAALKRPPRTVAFGKTLPPHLRHKPSIEDFRLKMLEPETIDRDVASMAHVWKDITHLYITNAYANWLKENTEIPVPEYLLEGGILEKKVTQLPMVDQTRLANLKKSEAFQKLMKKVHFGE